MEANLNFWNMKYDLNLLEDILNLLSNRSRFLFLANLSNRRRFLFLANLLSNRRRFLFLANGRGPKFLFKWKTTTGKSGLASPSFSWAWHSSAPACFLSLFLSVLSALSYYILLNLIILLYPPGSWSERSADWIFLYPPESWSERSVFIQGSNLPPAPRNMCWKISAHVDRGAEWKV